VPTSDILDDVALHLEAAGLGKTTSFTGEPWPIYLNDMQPDSGGSVPDQLIVLYETVGPPPTMVMGGGLPALVEPRLRVEVRAATPVVARDKAVGIWRALAVMGDQLVNNVRYLSIIPLSEPYLLRRDERDRPIYACNYAIDKELVPWPP
jgi:hypothetical protein